MASARLVEISMLYSKRIASPKYEDALFRLGLVAPHAKTDTWLPEEFALDKPSSITTTTQLPLQLS